MIKHELVVDEVELNDEFKQVAWKGRVVKVYEISELEREFMSHRVDLNSVKIWFFAQFDIDYCGG